MMKQTMHIVISGIVQGVGYRKFTKSKADELGIKGSVRNLENFSVEIYANGEFEILESFISILKIGPQRAVVEEVETSIVSKIDFKDFSILGD
ncbi:acylphosphatase [Helicobacter anseris]|nr:acylphosphatase [Helicobacter anseris]